MRLSKQEHKRCPHLDAGKVRICEAYSKGLKVLSKKEIFEFCEGQFHLCRTYQERTQSEEKTGKGGKPGRLKKKRKPKTGGKEIQIVDPVPSF